MGAAEAWPPCVEGNHTVYFRGQGRTDFKGVGSYFTGQTRVVVGHTQGCTWLKVLGAESWKLEGTRLCQNWSSVTATNVCAGHGGVWVLANWTVRGIALCREIHGVAERTQAGGQTWALVPALTCPALWPGTINSSASLSLTVSSLMKMTPVLSTNDTIIRTECLSVEKHKML